MITKIEAVNFRCLRNISQTLGHFHVITGPNGSGKTTVAGFPGDVLQSLATIEIEGSATNARLQELLDHHPSDITRLLQNLCNHGFLDSDNRRRWATYRFKENSRQQGLFEALEPIGDSSHKAVDSLHKAGDSSHLGGDSSHLGGDSSHLGGDPSAVENILAVPEVVTQVAQAGKVFRELMEEAILEVCSGRYWTLSQLAELLNRHPAGLRNRYISPMVAAGKLRLRFPRQGNRPDQAYTAVESHPPAAEPPQSS